MFLVVKPGSGGHGESVGVLVRGESGVFSEVGVERDRRQRRSVGGETFDEDVEEEQVGFREGEDEVTCVAYGFEVGELVGELGDDDEVVLVAIEDDLGVGLG